MTRILLAVLIILLAIFQYKLWFGDGGFIETIRFKKQITEQQKINADLQKRNTILMAEIEALKKNKNVIEAKARQDLGMIKNGETFYQVVK